MKRPKLTALLHPRALRPALGCLVVVFAGSGPGSARLAAQDAAAANHAPADGKETVAKAAEEALNEGLNAKAARLYEQAWNAGRDNPELGLKAAEIYIGALKQPLDAGRILQQVRRVATGPAGARTATLLQQIAHPLRAQVQELVKQAQASRDPAEQSRLLDQAEEAYPGYPALHQLRARLAAQGSSESAMLSALKGLARNKLATVGLVRSLPNLSRWLDMPAVKEYLTDMFGAQKVSTLARGGGPIVAGRPFVLDDAGNLKLVPIPAGSFAMGSTSGYSDERPVTQVTLTQGYWLGATEVTQAQWEEVMGSNPSNFKGPNLPVEQVSYDDAVEFCRKVTESEREAGKLPEGYVYTLPTEAQWEYACRAGTTGDFAGNLGAMAWYDGNSGGKTHDAGARQANGWGLFDMHGNVWEWCLDWKGDYPGGSVKDPIGAVSGSYRVNRGGGWIDSPSDCGSADRFSDPPTNRAPDLGFRLALTPVR